ncbi:MAG: hypothetical protein FJ104_13020, partial [Deltaproteobacteria bacterium]|nr:hypothetical protein [Deltaproteobacteria bacterium]
MRSPRPLLPVLLGALGCAPGCASDGDRGDPCLPDDVDGVIGGSARFVVT